jgi:hypothetical protein
MKQNPKTPHIKLVRNYWEIHSNRDKSSLVACSMRFVALAKIGPWRPAEIVEWYGDTKKPV